jgi:hypothetical protein
MAPLGPLAVPVELSIRSGRRAPARGTRRVGHPPPVRRPAPDASSDGSLDAERRIRLRLGQAPARGTEPVDEDRASPTALHPGIRRGDRDPVLVAEGQRIPPRLELGGPSRRSHGDPPHWSTPASTPLDGTSTAKRPDANRPGQSRYLAATPPTVRRCERPHDRVRFCEPPAKPEYEGVGTGASWWALSPS